MLREGAGREGGGELRGERSGRSDYVVVVVVSAAREVVVGGV